MFIKKRKESQKGRKKGGIHTKDYIRPVITKNQTTCLMYQEGWKGIGGILMLSFRLLKNKKVKKCRADMPRNWHEKQKGPDVALFRSLADMNR